MVRGRKRHLLVDTEGLVVKARVQSAKVADQDGIKRPLEPARGRLPRLSYLRVDADQRGRGKEWAERSLGVEVEVGTAPPSRRPRKSCGSGRGSGSRKDERWISASCRRARPSRICRAGGFRSAPSRGPRSPARATRARRAVAPSPPRGASRGPGAGASRTARRGRRPRPRACTSVGLSPGPHPRRPRRLSSRGVLSVAAASLFVSLPCADVSAASPVRAV